MPSTQHSACSRLAWCSQLCQPAGRVEQGHPLCLLLPQPWPDSFPHKYWSLRGRRDHTSLLFLAHKFESDLGNSPDQNSEGLPPLQKHSHLDEFQQASPCCWTGIRHAQILPEPLVSSRDDFPPGSHAGQARDGTRSEPDQMIQCFPLVLYSKELGMQPHEAAPNFFLGVFPF